MQDCSNSIAKALELLQFCTKSSRRWYKSRINVAEVSNTTICPWEMDFMFNSLWPSDILWWHRSGSTLAQAMACCLMAPSHHLNQFWFLISQVLWHSPKYNFTTSAQATIQYKEFENDTFENTATPPRGQCVKYISQCDSYLTFHG